MLGAHCPTLFRPAAPATPPLLRAGPGRPSAGGTEFQPGRRLRPSVTRAGQRRRTNLSPAGA
ncbi:hypothetical protein SFR_3688 [Streptomyces sp. FR-008]|nr:hypothetical protein SFR_3688 [Streptomyces sp. FR-008]